MFIITFLKVIGFFVIFYLVHNTYKKFKKLNNHELKGPMPLPILGNLHQFSELPHRDLTKMSERYGGIFRVWFADLYTVVLSDAELIRKIYIENADNFQDRPNIPSFVYGVYGTGTVSSRGEDWKRNRDIVSRALRKTNIKHIYDTLDDQVDVLINQMKSIEKSGQPFDPRYYMTKYTMSAMYKFIFNEEVNQDQDIHTGEIAHLMKTIGVIFEEFGAGSLFDVLEIAQPYYLKWLELTDKNYPIFFKFVKEKYDNHLLTYKPEVSRDLLDILISEYGTDTKNAVMNITSTMLDFFMAGVETSSTSLESMFALLINYPEIQEKAYNEIKSVMGDRSIVLLSDKQSMPYTVAVIKETLRFKMVTPFGLPRNAENDIIINDSNGKPIFIPKNAQILINFHTLLSSDKYFDNPNEFDPTRFLTTQTNPAFLPFSLGTRNCVGQQFANDEMFLAISNVLLNFKLNSINGKEIDITESYGITLKTKTHFMVKLEKRV